MAVYLRDEHGVRRPVRLTRRAHALIGAVGITVVVGQAALVASAVGLLPGGSAAHAAALSALPAAQPDPEVPRIVAGPAAPAREVVAGRADRSARGGPVDVAGPYRAVEDDLDDESVARTPVAVPVPGARITAEFGESGSNWQNRHTGLDFDGVTGDPILSATDGRVDRVVQHKAYGTMLVVRREDGVETWYAHLSKVLVDHGPVHAGEPIGLMGTTGNSTGSHLHFEVRVNGVPTDPAALLWGPSPGEPGTPPPWVCAIYAGC